jgi:hypothetical protein
VVEDWGEKEQGEEGFVFAEELLDGWEIGEAWDYR